MPGKVEWGDRVKVVKARRTGMVITTQVAGASGKLERVFVKYDKPYQRPLIGGDLVTGEWWDVDQVEAVGQSDPRTRGDEVKVKITPRRSPGRRGGSGGAAPLRPVGAGDIQRGAGHLDRRDGP